MGSQSAANKPLDPIESMKPQKPRYDRMMKSLHKTCAEKDWTPPPKDAVSPCQSVASDRTFTSADKKFWCRRLASEDVVEDSETTAVYAGCGLVMFLLMCFFYAIVMKRFQKSRRRAYTILSLWDTGNELSEDKTNQELPRYH